MTRTCTIASLIALSLALTAQNAQSAVPDVVELKGPISTSGADAYSLPVPAPLSVPMSVPVHLQVKQTDTDAIGDLAPGEDSTMTQDMILVAPTNPKQQVASPLSALTGTTLKMQIDRSDIVFDKLHGVMITVANDTNRPVVVDGDKAMARITSDQGGKTYTCAPVSVLQQAIVPQHKISRDFEDILTHAVPAAITVGAAPTIRDIINSRKPILERYGPDELRRKVEFSRFGRRILWTHEKMQGILYFQTNDLLAGVQIEIPATTLFDDQDTAVLVSGTAPR
jgi:hypothetical protein